MSYITENLIIEDARIAFRNFSGKEGRFNPVGKRNFCVLLEHEVALKLADEGWNIRWLTPRDVEDEPRGYMQVEVSFKNIPPKIVIVNEHGQTLMDEDSVSILDWADIKETKIIIRPYNWEVSGKKGVKAYLKTMYVAIVEDEFEARYSNTPAQASDVVGGCGSCEVCDGHCQEHDTL